MSQQLPVQMNKEPIPSSTTTTTMTRNDPENNSTGMMGDDQSIGTGMSALSYNSNQTNASKRSVFADALLILRGINPKDVILEEEDDPQNQNNDNNILESNHSYESAKQNEDDFILGKSVVLSKSGSHSSTTGNDRGGRRSMTNGISSNSNNNNSSSTGGVRWMEGPPHHVPRSSKGSSGVQHLSEISERSDGTTVQYIDFLQDDYRTMTYGRRIALYLMKHYKWYYPRLVKKTKHNEETVEHEQQQQQLVEEELIEPMHPLLAASINEQMKRSRTSKKNPLSPMKKSKTNNFVSYRDLIVTTSKSIEEDEEDDQEDDHDPAATIPLCTSYTSNNSATTVEEQQRLLLDGQYPFTHSRRENPTLEKAWAYFDHVALSRYVIPPSTKHPNEKKKCLITRIIRKVCCKANKKLERAEPGERLRPTALYQPIFTPHNQLGDFGLGIGLYFSTLRAITVITLLATLLNIPNFIYYASSEYTPGIHYYKDRQYVPMYHGLYVPNVIRPRPLRLIITSRIIVVPTDTIQIQKGMSVMYSICVTIVPHRAYKPV
jgi:hypothetical protein